jgi:uncharacterized protein (DUF2062 family)
MSTPNTDPTPSNRNFARIWHRIRNLASSSENPRRVVAAFAFGVFVSFSPFIGLQLLLAMSIATLLRLSRVAVFVGLWANLSWFMLPWYTLTTLAGAYLLRIPISSELTAELAVVMEHPVYRASFWMRLAELAGPFLWAYLLGSTLGAAVVGVATYAALAAALRRGGILHS